MTQSLYADATNVAQALDTADNRASINQPVTVRVFDTDVVMRGITLDEAKDRNLLRSLDAELCSFKYDGTRLTLRVHESRVDGTFELTPAGPDAIAADQATDPIALAPAIGPVLDALETEANIVSYDFSGVSAASIANGGHLTDFEFEYIVIGY